MPLAAPARALLLMLAAPLVVGTAAAASPANLQVEYMTDPLGVDTVGALQFSWRHAEGGGGDPSR
eukprot:gene15938-16473_t